MKKEKKFLIPEAEIVSFDLDDIITDSDPSNMFVIDDDDVPLYS